MSSATTMAAILREHAPFVAVIMGAAALLAATGTGDVMAQQPPMGCTNAIVSLSPCLSYMMGTTNPLQPTYDCCTLLATIISNDAVCLCQLFASDDFLGFPVNRTLAISLPASCNLVFPRRNDQCNGAFPPSSAGAVDLPENPTSASPPSGRGRGRGSRPPRSSPAPRPGSRPPPPRSHAVPPPPILPLVPFPPDGPAGSPGQVQTPPAKRSGSGALFTPPLFGILLGSIFTGIFTGGCFL